MNTFLLEIGIAEAPSNMILPAVDQLRSLINNTCEAYKLNFGLIKTYSTPRRFVVIVEGLPNKQNDVINELKGPSIEIALDKDKKWTKPAIGFAKKNGININDLKFKNFDGKEYLFFQQKRVGRPVPEILQKHIVEWINQINFPKNMRWGSYKMKFIRPIRWVMSIWNKVLIPIKLEMLESGQKTYGHRFLSHGMILIKNAGDYKKQLKKLNVIVDFEERRKSISSQVKELENEFGFEVELNEDLLTEVTNLVEWPTVILGNFEKKFLELPDQVLITSMAVNQRYFPVFKKNKKQIKDIKELMPFFISVRNGDKKNIDIVRRGNGKVLSARLKDATFFYGEDQKKKLEFFCEKSKNVIFFPNRGTQSERVQRISLLSKYIAEKLNLSLKQKKIVEKVSQLSKFDLGTLMVQEFPKLQGYMGGIYASLKNESELVCRGICEHYLPRHSNDNLPENIESVVVSIADKLDLLCTAFSLNLKPSGATDPFALRRAAQGSIQLILELRLSLDYHDLISKGLLFLNEQQSLDIDNSEIKSELLSFLLKRQRWYMQEKGFRNDLIEAVFASITENFSFDHATKNPVIPVKQLEFVELLSDHIDTKIFKRSVESIVRAENICRKYPDKISDNIKISDLLLEEEKNFFKILQPIITSKNNLCWDANKYLNHFLLIEPVVTSFFENVLVMDQDPIKCGNRLKLCQILANWSKRHLDLKVLVFP